MGSPRWTLAGVAIVAAIVLWAPPDRALDDLAVPDGEEYAIAAFNLSETHRYEIILDGEAHPPRYPFGYPLLTAAANILSGPRLGNAVYVNIAVGVATVCLAAASAALLAPGTATAASLLAALLLLTSRIFFTDTHWVMSEALLMFLFLGHAHAAARACASSRSFAWAFFAGLAVGWAGAVRITSLALALPAGLSLLLWVPRRRRAVLLAYFVGGSLFTIPLLVYNARTFGSPLRSGYQYWCSNPYDLLSNTYSLGTMLREKRWWFYLRELHHRMWESAVPETLAGVPGLAALLAGVVALTFYVGIVRLARSGDRGARAWLVVALSTIAATLVQYALYFIVAARFLEPLLPLCCVLLGVGIAALARTRGHVLAGAFVVGWLIVFAARVESVSRERSRFVDAPPSVTERFMRQAAERLEPDAVIISNNSPVLIGHFLLRGNRRRYVPYDRAVEYASKYAQPVPPRDLSLLPANPVDHRYEGALANGARQVFTQTFSDDREAVLQDAIDRERAVYLLIDTRGNVPLPPGLALEEEFAAGPFRLVRIRVAW